MVSSAGSVDTDIVVVGAGAAGVAAALSLQGSGLSVRVLEARGRVGGRAHTLREGMPAPLDLGCEWLHSADENPVVAAAQALGLTIDRTRADWGSHVGTNFPPEDRAAFQVAVSRFWDAAEAAATDDGPDHPASSVLEPGNRWNPLIGAISTYYNGTELDDVSLIDLHRYVDTGVNWRIAEGYGTFVERAAKALDLRRDCAVSAIDHSGTAIRVRTPSGAITTRAVVVTVPTNVLAGGAIRFFPDLPEKRDAAASLPLGLADKIFFSVADDAGIPAGHLFGATDRVEAISFDLRPRGVPIVQGFVGGRFARELEKGGPSAFEMEARAQLTRMLGADMQRHLTFLRATAWAADPFAQGAYSHAMPGHADARITLAEPVDGRLFFAGEACSSAFFSTAHGAWQTGLKTARAIREHFGRADPPNGDG